MATEVEDLQTLRSGPFWLLSALTGQPSPGADERLVCAQAIESLANTLSDLGVGHLLLDAEDDGAIALAAIDDRPVATGLANIATALRGLDPVTAMNYRRTLLTFGFAIAKALGPFGKSITPEDGQTLVVCAALLDHTGVPPVVALAA